MEIKAGMLARSKAGHDKDRVYMIVALDGLYAYLADGSLKPMSSPKKKKLKHIQPIREEHDMEGMDDIRIRMIIKRYLDGVSPLH